MPNGNGAPRRWRGWHVVARFLPMIFLGLILIVIGGSTAAHETATHNVRAEPYGILLLWVGIVLVICAFLGMVFTKCPVCYRTHWIVCVQEPDVVHTAPEEYRRELSLPEEEA
jgi:hypothetical protein